jgi:hypothetical protein
VAEIADVLGGVPKFVEYAHLPGFALGIRDARLT